MTAINSRGDVYQTGNVPLTYLSVIPANADCLPAVPQPCRMQQELTPASAC
jgi:hypothetical protein